MLEIRGVAKTYPNGAGKSSLVRTFATLQPPAAGGPDGKNPARESRRRSAALASALASGRRRVGTLARGMRTAPRVARGGHRDRPAGGARAMHRFVTGP